ncbi:hypothetical protein P9D51_22700 [Bacillus sonorensis]|uniref:hypothetical protein n=1 Tax=Bacillus sonorensis TaxID=119858 RepID=UPI0022821EB8|nr:hypothetical protein [Bacillus sonorensis]MCY8035624.1 hypothetical protein [Bacillus sonorensis]MCY8563685.1 hypothetical protein [Bacillus sonorensis]MEC1428854.1 hypothetical protein [Bacillus sonorensis]
MGKDKEEFKKRMAEAHGSEVADALFGAVESPELSQRIKERTRTAAEEARKTNTGKTRVVYRADLDPRLDGRTIIDENGDRVIQRKLKRK